MTSINSVKKETKVNQHIATKYQQPQLTIKVNSSRAVRVNFLDHGVQVVIGDFVI